MITDFTNEIDLKYEETKADVAEFLSLNYDKIEKIGTVIEKVVIKFHQEMAG